MSDGGEEIKPSATVSPTVHRTIEGVISKSFSHLSSNLSFVIESRLSEFKRGLAVLTGVLPWIRRFSV